MVFTSMGEDANIFSEYSHWTLPIYDLSEVYFHLCTEVEFDLLVSWFLRFVTKWIATAALHQIHCNFSRMIQQAEKAVACVYYKKTSVSPAHIFSAVIVLPFSIQSPLQFLWLDAIRIYVTMCYQSDIAWWKSSTPSYALYFVKFWEQHILLWDKLATL